MNTFNIYGLFSDAISVSENISSDDRTVLNDEWKRVRKEALGGYFEELMRRFLEVTEKIHKTPSLNTVSADNRIGVLPNPSQERSCLRNLLGYVGL
jgi:hypothetical protein